ncbi:MAG TPA: sensor histidine kinase, partial [Clostridia bacterium]|nr:sensor histidine kinase [Clostridia bacterium]
EISLHILDILQNSREADATKILLWVLESRKKDALKFKVVDNGLGMETSFVQQVFDPFITTRQTRKVGLGLAMLKATAEASGGYVKLDSCPGKGTRLEVAFQYSHLDRPPLGNLAGSLAVFLMDAHDLHLRYVHWKDGRKFTFDSRAFAEEQGESSLEKPWLFPLLLRRLEQGFKEL